MSAAERGELAAADPAQEGQARPSQRDALEQKQQNRLLEQTADLQGQRHPPNSTQVAQTG